MAGDDLIEAYLADVAVRLASCADVDDVVAELRDHLLSSVEARTQEDREPADDARRRVLERFGAPETIAAGLLGARRSPLLGRAAGLCCALWPTLAVAWWASLLLEGTSASWGGPPQAAYLTGAVALLGAAALTVAVTVALAREHGGLGWWGRAGTACGAAAVLASAVGWLVPVWASLLALATAAVAAGLARRGAGPRRPLAALTAAWTAAALAWLLVRASGPGPAAIADPAPSAELVAVTVGACSAALAAYALRRRLVAAPA